MSLDQQMRKAIVSVTNNIAEGHGRWYYLENIRFCLIFWGSVEYYRNEKEVRLHSENQYSILPKTS